jgi:hypothetical protein
MAKKDKEIELEEMPVDNVGIMQGFLEMLGEDDDDYKEDDDEMEAGAILGRTPDSPEILMNNLRGDMRSLDARRDELADLVGYAAAAETPEPVLAMLQPVLAQQGIAAMMPPAPMPPGGISPVGAPMMPNVPNQPSPMMQPSEPMPAGGIGDMAPPVQMAKGGIVQHFQKGSDEGAVTPAADASSGIPGTPQQVALSRALVSSRLAPQTIKPFDLEAETARQQQIYEKAIGANDSKELARTQMLLDLAGRGFGYAANVDEQGRPLRGSALSRFAQATRTLPQTVGQFISQQAKQDQSIRLAALQAAQKVQERDIATQTAARKEQFDAAIEILKQDAKQKGNKILTTEEAMSQGLPTSTVVNGQQFPFVYQQEIVNGVPGKINVILKPPQITSISLGDKAEAAYGTDVGKLAAERDTKLYQSAENAPQNISKINDLIKLVKDPDSQVGFLSSVETAISKVKDKLLNKYGEANKVTNSELIDTMLGSEVFTMLPALGIGARGMDTPAERTFLLEVMTGKRSMTRETLLEMANYRRKREVYNLNKYNNRVDTGDLDAFFKYGKLKKKTFEMPTLESIELPPALRGPDPRNDADVEAALSGGR